MCDTPSAPVRRAPHRLAAPDCRSRAANHERSCGRTRSNSEETVRRTDVAPTPACRSRVAASVVRLRSHEHIRKVRLGVGRHAPQSALPSRRGCTATGRNRPNANAERSASDQDAVGRTAGHSIMGPLSLSPIRALAPSRRALFGWPALGCRCFAQPRGLTQPDPQALMSQRCPRCSTF